MLHWTFPALRRQKNIPPPDKAAGNPQRKEASATPDETYKNWDNDAVLRLLAAIKAIGVKMELERAAVYGRDIVRLLRGTCGHFSVADFVHLTHRRPYLGADEDVYNDLLRVEDAHDPNEQTYIALLQKEDKNENQSKNQPTCRK